MPIQLGQVAAQQLFENSNITNNSVHTMDPVEEIKIEEGNF